MSAIEVDDLHKRYGTLHAVDGLSFRVEGGEVFGLLGPNGAGKTSTIEILVGLRRADAGRLRILGRDPARHAAELRKRIGVQLQQVALYPRLTVLEMARLFASFYPSRLDPVETIARVALLDKARTQTKDLSGGQRQRLAIALTLVGDPELLFLDEPTTGLDPQARRSIWDLVREQKARGKTVLLTTHAMDEAEALCDRVAIVERGRIIALDSPRTLVDAHFAEKAIEFESEALAHDQALATLAGVSRVHVGDGSQVTLYASDVAAAVSDLVRHADRRRTPLEGLVVRRATLEDVFLDLAGRSLRA